MNQTLSPFQKRLREKTQELTGLSLPAHLHQRYIIERKPAKKIGEELECSESTIGRLLREFDIPVDLSGKTLKRVQFMTGETLPDYFGRIYLGEKKSPSEIGKELGSSPPEVRRLLKRFKFLP